MYLRQLPLLVASFAFAACVGNLDNGTAGGGGGGGEGEGGGGGGGDDITNPDAGVVETVNYEMAVTPALAEIELGKQVSFTAEISSENFSGPITLDLVGALDTWNVIYTPAQTVDLLPNETTSVVVSVQVPTNGAAGNAGLTFALSGELGTRAGNAQMNVANQVTFDIPAGTGGGVHAGMSGSMIVREDTLLIWTNSDSVLHRIHSSPHGDDFGPGTTYSFPAGDAAAEEDPYCHNHGAGSGLLDLIVEPSL